MVAWLLVEPNIQNGAEFLHELDEAGLPVSAAFWLLNEEAGIPWRLNIASPIYDELGPTETYRRLQDVLRARAHRFDLQDVAAISPTNPTIAALRRLAGGSPDVAGIRLRGNAGNGIYIEDAYVYRLT